VTAAFVLLWVAAAFGLGFFARELERFHLFGWPLAYYWGAQGALIVFLLIIGGYALAMRLLDRAALRPEVEAGEPR
jgi:putative solute:sodium symporter small subunit